MRVKFSFLTLLFLLALAVQPALAKSNLESLAEKATSESKTEAAPAIDRLRSLGPNGLQALIRENEAEISLHIANPTIEPSAEWQRITAALDAVSQQRNSYLSGLYWYTDLNQAKRVASETGKPILSLRLLGKLTDELSCANSRFFRTILYSNEEISSILRDRFVLHWQTVRPVPLITIDFGDGRKLARTITGNSIHYVLDTDGKPIEAFPGVYGPAAFIRNLADAEKLFAEMKGKNETEKRGALYRYLRARNNRISVDWYNEIVKLGVKPPAGMSVEVNPNGEALAIMPLAVSKAMTEATVLRSMTSSSDALGRITDETTWQKLASLHSSDSVLDKRSISLIRKQNPSLNQKAFDELVLKFQQIVALDTVRNEYRMHSRLLAWLSRDASRNDIDKFNEKVYAELFLTPKSDPWLGLLMPDAYTAIDNSGVVN